MRVGSGGCRQSNAVTADALIDVDSFDCCLHGQQHRCVRDLTQCLLLVLTDHPPPQHIPFFIDGRIAETDPQHEPVELSLRERVGALVLDRVRSGDHVKGRLERERLTLHRDLTLLHCLEQGRLRLRWGPVDLIGEEESREQRPPTEGELSDTLVIDERAGEVGREQVRRELSPSETEAQGLCERSRSERLAESREILDQHVTTGQNATQHDGQGVAFTDNGELNLVEHLVRETRDFGQRERRPAG